MELIKTPNLFVKMNLKMIYGHVMPKKHTDKQTDNIKKVIHQVTQACKKALDAGANPIAAFDADGTLWDTDIGENFFKHQAEHKLVELPEDAWNYYVAWHEKDPIPAYLWLAQINKGVELSTVRQWAKDALSRYEKVPVFPHMIELIQTLKDLKVKVYIVTASIKWAVEPAAKLVGLAPEDVLGIQTKVDESGLVTETQDGPITWREGKVTGLLRATGNKDPFFAAGNSPGDLFLLQAASHVALANSLAKPGSSVYESEQELLAEALKRNWFRISAQ